MRPRKHSDEEILQAARAIFLEHGPSASLQMVADQVAMSQPALFKRFGTKENFLLAALAPTDQLPWMEKLIAGPDDRPMPDQLYEICLGSMEFFAVAVPCMMTLRASRLDLHALVRSDAPGAPQHVRRNFRAFFARARARGLIRGMESQHADLVLIGSLQARAMMAHMVGEPLTRADMEEHAAAVVDVLWSGLRPEQKGVC